MGSQASRCSTVRNALHQEGTAVTQQAGSRCRATLRFLMPTNPAVVSAL